MRQIYVNAARLERTIRDMGAIGLCEETNGRNRLALSGADKQGRDLFCRWLGEAGLEVRIDAIGNIFGLRGGTNPGGLPVMLGSHLDSVKNAGMFDGVVGVLGALEVARTLNDNGIRTERPLVIADFTNEEGARFQFDMMGSSFYAGMTTIEEIYPIADDNGLTVGDELSRIGYKGCQTVPVGNYLEFHVEQGPVLDAEGLQIGVVEGIQGITWWGGEFTGEANHAGTTPMRLRQDALLGVAELAVEMEKLTARVGNDCVATMGRIRPEPDVINVVPGKCFFTADVRQFDPELFEKSQREMELLMKNCAERRGLQYKFEKLCVTRPVVFDKSMVSIVEDSAKEMGLSAKRLYSGAGHDAQHLAKICPTAMIFVPSRKGLSHCPEEYTDFAQIADGCNVLLQSVLKLAIIRH